MSLYARAVRHGWWMASVLAVTILFVLVVEVFVGHSNLAFGAAIVVLVFANARMLGFNCPKCRKNLFFRGMLAVPWPNRICARCGHDLDAGDSSASQNR
jgi:hypothetical protein